MKINEKIEKLINGQINMELGSWYVYLSMSAYFEEINLSGFAGWMRLQAEEEYKHAMKFYHYLTQRSGIVRLEKIEKPEIDWKSAQDVFEDAYKHELKVSKSIHDIYEEANKEKDFATASFLKWFLDEQVEEEASALEILERLKEIKGEKGPLMLLNRELGMRKN